MLHLSHGRFHPGWLDAPFFIEGSQYEKFEDHRENFLTTFQAISPRKRTRKAITNLDPSAAPRTTMTQRETTDRLLDLTQQSTLSTRRKEEAELAAQHLITQPVVYAMVKLRVSSIQLYDTRGVKKGPIDKTSARIAPFMCASDIVRMLVLRSKADQIMLHRWSWWSVVIVSWAHAALPILRHLVEKPYETDSK